MNTNDIGYLLNKATRRMRLRLGEALAGTGLRPQQAAALIALSHSPEGSMTPRALAEAIDTDAASTSGLIDRLSRDGWIASAPNPDDGRSRLLMLTDKAELALPGVVTAADDVSAQATSSLTASELEVLRDLLSRIHPCDELQAAANQGGSI